VTIPAALGHHSILRQERTGAHQAGAQGQGFAQAPCTQIPYPKP